MIIPLINKIRRNMKLRNAFLLAVVVAGASIAALCPKPTPAGKDAVILQKMVEVLGQLHFNPQDTNVDFSKKVYKVYLDRLDGSRRFLTQQDVDQLKNYENKIGDAVRTQDFTFYTLSQKLLDAGIVKAETYYNAALTAPLDFTINEKINIDSDKKPYAKNDDELKDMWRKMIKYDVETRLSNKLDDKIKGKTDVKDKSDEELKKAALTETTKSYNDYFKRLKKVKPNNRFGVYLNSIANVYDPHTEYFEPVDKQAFDIRMSGRLIGIGARLQTDLETDFTKVTDIVIGGPAYKEGELKEGDLVMKVGQGDKEPVDVAGMNIDEVVSMIRGELGKQVRLTVKSKIDGKVKTIPIIREEIVVDEGFARSLIIESEKTSEKIGYIKLPMFYADFEREDGHQCAEDIEIEVKKLQQAGVKGIILDLRNNGGGSLRDVVKMAGQFIESGPIVQVKNRLDRPEVMSDTDPTVQYNGPLIIMQNEFSASASEIMAAALQDYGRAIIVGTNSYGKGTVQRFFDLDRALTGSTDLKPLGQIKVTIQKFYRVNGGATQLKGVAPDILLPDSYMNIPSGEKDNEYPMPWTQIKPVRYAQNVVDFSKVLPKIIENSKKRVDASPVFKAIIENAKLIKQQRDRSEETLNLATYIATEKKQQEYSKKLNNLIKMNDESGDEITSVTSKSTEVTKDKKDKKTLVERLYAENLQVDLDKLTAAKDSSKIIRNTDWLKNVKNDAQLQETLFIMKDLIQNATFKTAYADVKKN